MPSIQRQKHEGEKRRKESGWWLSEDRKLEPGAQTGSSLLKILVWQERHQENF